MTDELRPVPITEWLTAARSARDEGFTYFDWLSAVDQTDDEEAPGLEVVCHLLDTGTPPALRGVLLSTRVPDGISLESLTPVYAGAAWHERETHEMFGLALEGFTDPSGLGLRPLLLPDGFEGTPLRKSFVLAARASKPWPGAKEPGESDKDVAAPAAGPAEGGRPARTRRRVTAPGIPDPEWGPR